MSTFSKQIIAFIAIVFLIVMVWVGTYLPYRKGARYVDALNHASQAKSLQEIGTIFGAPLDLSSPVGQEEETRNFGSIMGNIIAGNSKTNHEVASEGLKLLGTYSNPLIDRGTGLSYAQTLLVTGSAYEAAYEATGEAAYGARAADYFRKGLVVSPNRPQFLYALFSYYQVSGDTVHALEVGKQIFSFWPNDVQIKGIVDGLGNATTSR